MKFTANLLFIISGFINVHAQTIVHDSVTMNPGYQEDVFYNFYSGTKTQATISNWDLAFCINPMDVGIRVNSGNGTALWAVPTTDTSGWASLDSAGFQAWQELHNTDSSMFTGAFNINNTPNQFDFSWGVYDFNTHEVIGDSLFLIKVTDAQGLIYFKKLWIIKRADNASHDWIFRYANLDNTGDMTVTIPTASYIDKNFIYYSITSGTTNDREPLNTEWDMQFTRYTTDVGGGYYYPVTGVYSNNGVQVADVRPVDVSATNSDQPFLNLYTDNMSEIGYDWKTFNMSLNMWEIEDSLVYFVRTNAGEVYKLVYTGFDGSTTGNIYFDKTLIYTTGISDAMIEQNYFIIYPNPAHEIATLIYPAPKQGLANLQITDLNGKCVFKNQVLEKEGLNKFNLNISSLSRGIYFVELKSEQHITRQKLIVQ